MGIFRTSIPRPSVFGICLCIAGLGALVYICDEGHIPFRSSLLVCLLFGAAVIGTILGVVFTRMVAQDRGIDGNKTVYELTEAIDYGIVLVDTTGKVDWCNGTFGRLLNLQRCDIVGHDLLTILRLSDSGTELPRQAHPVAMAMNRETSIAGCFQLIHSGKTLEISVQPVLLGHKKGFALTIRDLTNNLQHEQVILQSHALKAVPHAIVITDCDGLVQWANPAFTKLTGYTLADVHNRTLNILKSGEHGKELYMGLWETIKKGDIWSEKLINRRKDGSLYIGKQTITPVRDSEDRVKQFIAVMHNVTQREEAIRKLEDQEKSLQELLSASADSSLQCQEKIRKILKLASERLNMEVAVICQLEDGTLRIQDCIDPDRQIKENEIISASDGLNHMPLLLQQPVLCTETDEDVEYHLSPFGRDGEFKAYLGSLIAVDGVPTGTLSFATRTPLTAKLGDSEKTFALLVSQWIGGEMSKERMDQREMDIAAKIQSTLSTEQVERHLEGLDLAALSKASLSIDGDFLDVFEFAECTDVVIGDVVGKGVSAALLGAATKNNLLRVLSSMQADSVATRLPTPQEVITSLHALVTPRLLELEKFVTLVYARYTFSERNFEFVDCGHMPILHFSASDQSWQEWKGGNTPIGFLARENYMQKRIRLEIDDILVLYSDGITEACSPAQEMYGPERLKRCVALNAGRLAKEIVTEIWESLLAFTQRQECEDDVTCIVLKVTNEHLGSVLNKQSETIITDTDTFSLIRRSFAEFCEQIPQPELRSKCQTEVLLAVHEAVTNIYNHAHHGEYGMQIEYLFEIFEYGIRISLSYEGNRFSGTMGTTVQNSGLSESGHGLTIISNAVDHSAYRCDDNGLNRIILTKYFKDSQATRS